ncbi:hypothetical protein BLOT_010389 [Blomia tropicalis]|nr:hypothetical protein BLOT_010389 [Blomia tropicalis]
MNSIILFVFTLISLCDCKFRFRSHPTTLNNTNIDYHNQPKTFLPINDASDCKFNANKIIDYILDRMKINLQSEKIKLKKGQLTVYDANFSHIGRLSRYRNACARMLNSNSTRIQIPIEAEIFDARLHAMMKYSIFVSSLYGEYWANFSQISLNGTLEADLANDPIQLWVNTFKIVSSKILDDRIEFGAIPKWILNWIRSFVDQDNSKIYEQPARTLLIKETKSFYHFDMIYDMIRKT